MSNPAVQAFKDAANKLSGFVIPAVNKDNYSKLAGALDLVVGSVGAAHPSLKPRLLISTKPEGQVAYDSSKGEKNTFENFQQSAINAEHSIMTRTYIAQGQHDHYSGVPATVVKSLSKSGSAVGNRNYEATLIVDPLNTPQYYLVLSYDA